MNVGGHRLWVTDKGAGPPVVLLHSLFFDSRLFEPVAPALVDEHRVLAVDVRDHGRSGGPDERWSLREAASEVERAVAQLAAGPVHVVGVSMGGMIALRWALAHPERVRSLGLVSTTHEPEVRARLHKAMAHGVRVGGRLVARLLMPYTVDKMFSDAWTDSPEADAWARRIATTEPSRLYRSAQAVFDRAGIGDRLDEVQAPSLVLVGAEDDAIPPSHGRRLAGALPDAEIVEVPDAGHLLPIEAADDVADELVHFLRRAQARAAGES